MPKRPRNLETVLLSLELLRRIPRGRKASASELHIQLRHAGFDRDLRSIQRQLDILSEHFDIERDARSKPYGYRWKEKATALSVPALSEQQSLLLMLAEQHLRNLLPTSLLKSMEGFFYQARSSLGPLTSAKRGREWLGKVRVVSQTQPLLPPQIKSAVFEHVTNALYANRWLNIEYRNAAGTFAKTEVMPLGLAQQGERLYLVCRYPDFDNERILAINRIISAHATTRTFDRPSNFNLERFDGDGRFGFGDGKRIRLSFHIAKEAGLHLLESPLSADQTVTEMAHHYHIKATVVETQQLEWWLRGFGDQISSIRRMKVVRVGPSI